MKSRQGKRSALLRALRELREAGLINFQVGAERPDGTGPHLDVWATKDVADHVHKLPELSARARMAWAVLHTKGVKGATA